MWWYEKVRKIVVPEQEMCWANAGSVVHHVLEAFHKKECTVTHDLFQLFEKEWNSFKLDDTRLKNDKEIYWGMILRGINANINATSVEYKICYEYVLAYLDVVDTENDIIHDHKTSKRTPETDEEYTLQLKMYAWLYAEKFGRHPKQCVVHYLRSGEVLTIEPTPENIIDVAWWYQRLNKEMEMYATSTAIPDACPTCNPWCPYKKLCEEELASKDLLVYTITRFGDRLQLMGHITPLLEKGIEKKFSYELKNSHWIKKAHPQANTTIRFWKSARRELPIGFVEGLTKTLNDYAAHVKKPILIHNNLDKWLHYDDTVLHVPNQLIGKTLREYQVEAIEEFLKHKIGVLELCTGAGKTLCAAEIIRRVQRKTLFIVDKIELLRQTKKVFEEALGMEIGIIGGDEVVLEHVTVATIQSLVSKKIELCEYLKTIRVVVFDECHHAPASSYRMISQYLPNTEYRLGLSGTAFRGDGNDMMIEAVTGPVVHRITSKQLIAEGWLQKPQVIFINYNMSGAEQTRMNVASHSGLINETPNYNNMYKPFISENPIRNTTIINLCHQHQGKKILILTRLVEHGQELAELLQCSHLYGETSKDERRRMFERFVSGECPTLVSTISIFGEGVDIPSLDVIINASANKGDIKTIQVLGRVIRKLEGKTEAYYYDFNDYGKFFTHASYSRKRILEKQGHEVEDWLIEN